MTRTAQMSPRPLGEQGGVGGGLSSEKKSDQSLRSKSLQNCSDCGQQSVTPRHFSKKTGRCRKAGTPSARASEPFALLAPVPAASEREAEVERRLRRYSRETPELQPLEADDWQAVNAVLTLIQCNRKTGAWLPAARRLEILDQLQPFHPLVVCHACVSFHRAGASRFARRPVKYLVAICGDSATKWFAQVVGARMERGEFELAP